MSYSLSSVHWGYTGDYIGDYSRGHGEFRFMAHVTTLGFRVQGLGISRV